MFSCKTDCNKLGFFFSWRFSVFFCSFVFFFLSLGISLSPICNAPKTIFLRGIGWFRVEMMVVCFGGRNETVYDKAKATKVRRELMRRDEMRDGGIDGWIFGKDGVG